MNSTVALVGKCSLHREQAPFGNLDVDIWSLNELLSRRLIPRATAMFEMHMPEIWDVELAHNDPNYRAWIHSPHEYPIYMLDWYPLPCCVKYPLEHVCRRFDLPIYHGKKRKEKFFSHTAAYMLALALLAGYRRVELYGIEMEAGEGEGYGWQRDCMFFWMGVAAGMGVEVVVPENSRLFVAPLYGYEPGDPRLEWTAAGPGQARWEPSHA